MTSAEDYESMAQRAYFADPLARTSPAKAGEKFYTGNDRAKQQWQVLQVSANASNGFQAMAVVPVVNGVKDESRIYIAYAGTNFGDPHDVVDFGVILYNLGLTGPAQTIWSMDKNSPYSKVLVAMEPAIALADRIHGLAEKLEAIKKANKGLETAMRSALDEATSEYANSHQWVTHADVENSVALHALDVDHNLNHESVESVNRLVDHQLALVDALHRGIKNAVVNTLAHDVRSAAAFTQHEKAG